MRTTTALREQTPSEPRGRAALPWPAKPRCALSGLKSVHLGLSVALRDITNNM
jgi:hypothetical protein